ncbi:MAG: glycosyltransferase [Verrucomicrobiota bacterium]
MKNDAIGILAFVPDLWSLQRQSRHHILEGLSKHYKVLWVSPPMFVEGWRRDGVRSSLAGRGLRKISDRLWAYAAWVPSDYKQRYSKKGMFTSCFRVYHRLWRAAYVRRIKRLLRAMGIDEVILYVWRPEFHWTLGRFSEKLSCYHIDDEYSFDPSRDQPISEEERKLLTEADLVFIHSKTLLEKKGHINPNTFCVPNGVDFEHYRTVLQQDAPEPPDLASIPHPRIGCMGHIKRHIDLSLLRAIAEARPDWSLVLVGPVRENHEDIREDVSALKGLPNVYFLGGKAALELPRYVNGFDVALMPYRKTPYTHYIYPMKMHEYFACGKPVVATELENLKEFSHVLDFAEGVDNWIASIDRNLKCFTNECRESRVAVARENSWKERVDGLATLLAR